MVRIGTIIADEQTPNHLRFRFQLEKGKVVSAGEFVEARDDKEKKIFIAQVERPKAYNPIYADEYIVQLAMEKPYKDPSAILPSESITTIRTARAGILGTLKGETFDFTGEAPEPGWEVHKATSKWLMKSMKLEEKGIYLGRLRHHHAISVVLDPLTTYYHFAILGVTGSGKSYAGAVIVEELADKGHPVVIIDPHGEYHTLSTPSDDKKLEQFGLKSKTYPVEEYAPREFLRDGQEELNISASDLNATDLIEITQLPGAQQQNLIYMAVRDLRRRRQNYRLHDLIGTIKKIGGDRKFRKDTIQSLCLRLDVLRELHILGEGIDPRELVKPRQVTIVNVSGTDEIIQRVMVTAILRRLFNSRRSGEVPGFFLVVDEAQRYAPQVETTVSKSILRALVREGRKFGIGCCILSQRPVDVDKVMLSQCNTRLILKIDNVPDLNAIAPYLGNVPKELVDTLPFFPAGRAILSGLAIGFPAIVEIRMRKTKHGGGTAALLAPERRKAIALERKGLLNYSGPTG